jgi:DNA modification methylase
MDLRNADCLEEMKNIDDNSIDLLFCDLPYTNSKFGKATSCKWDCEIDLDLFWKQVNRICRDDTPMIFTCTTKFGNCLINSNPKNFRYDLVWVKSASVGFLNAKKMPMKKHEMVYVFYRKLPKVYTDNIALHHTHKFIKKELGCEGNVYGQRDISTNINEYQPKLPNTIIKEDNKPIYDISSNSSLYGSELKRDKHKNRKNRESIYEPPLPNSIIKEDNTFIRGKNKKSKEDVYNYDERINNGKLYHHARHLQKGDESIYDPPLPNTIIKEGDIEKYKHKINNAIIKNNSIYGQGKGNTPLIDMGSIDGKPCYDPPLPNSIMEIKSEKGKHSTQKPVALMEWILKYYSKENDIVLDATMGSGSTGQACKNMNRKFIGIEKDKDIYETAFERLID